MRKNKTKRLVFTGIRKLPVDSHLQNSQLPASPSWKLYRRTTDLTLDRFITCYCDDDLTGLVISGKPPTEELQLAWDPILEDFSRRMATAEYTEIEDLTKEINLMKTCYNAVKTIVELLKFFPIQEVVDLTSPSLDFCLGFHYPLDLSDKAVFLMQLEGAMGHATPFYTEAMAMQVQLPKVKPEDTPKKVTHEFFDEVIVALSRYNKYKISKRETTVSEFTAMVQDMRRGIDAARKMQDN